MKLKDLPEERGKILQNFISIDNGISLIIARHYLGDSPITINNKENDFLVNVLGDDQFAFSLKRNIFIHILRVDDINESLIHELNKINKLRNIFAHRKWIVDSTFQDPEADVYFANPKFPWDKSKNIPAETLKNEFYSLLPDLINWIFELCKKKGYEFPNPQIIKDEIKRMPEQEIKEPIN